jgi:chemotaxis protein MotB
MAGHGGGRRGGGHEEEHENHERWLVSYADMMTLLMVLFIVLFAISQVDQKKFAALKDGLASGLGNSVNAPVTGGTGISSTEGVMPAAIDLGAAGAGTVKDSQSTQQKATQSATAGSTAHDTLAAARREAADLAEIERRITTALRAKGLADSVRYKVSERGLIVALVSDDVFFANASADLRPQGREVLQAVGPVLRTVRRDVAVEGHANHLALRSSVYPSNWELSAARAGGVVRYLQSDGGLSPSRLSATGFGSSRAMYPSTDKRSIRFNRRVDVVLLSDQPSAVRTLVPKIAPKLSTM